MYKTFKSTAIIVALLTSMGTAHSAPIVYAGSDDGASITGPWVNSAVAETNFKTDASTYGSLQTITFES